MEQRITAPLAGKIVHVNIEVGARVEEDAEALVIEAIKMETEVFAPCDGTVKEIKVKVGDQVEEDDLLALISSD